ncbi:MAG TPA: DUF1905 domain-containing protein [Erythrobacter sp.]|nr:DUF1905 domain-containing protein [Erythrobacter sp.]
MSELLTHSSPLTRWQGERGTWHLLVITGETAEAIAMHARLYRLEYGTQRGFGSVKVMARIGETEWKSSVFPQKSSSQQEREWILLVSRKVMRAEDIVAGDRVCVELELL